MMRMIRGLAIILAALFLCSDCFGYTGGAGTVLSPYQIADSDDLLQLADTPADYSKYFILTADIDLHGQVFNTAIIAKDTNSGAEGFQGTAFTGVFDGDGHRILNFTISGGSNYYLGLFGQIGLSVVKDLGLENCAVIYSTDSKFVGGLAGVNYEASISHCYMAGDVGGDADTIYIGGLIGLNFKGVVDSCDASGSAGGNLNVGYTGGLVGFNSGYGVITNCHTTGIVSGDFEVGGLCGENAGIISQCYAAGDVIGPNNSFYLGGLCGSNYGTIQSCYATGAVSGGDDSLTLGGLCGENLSVETIIDCYATGSVTGGDYSSKLGGLCGENFNGVISNCYSTGVVASGISSVLLGGLCGYHSDSVIDNSFWDTQASTMDTGYNLDEDFPGTIMNVFGLTTDPMRMQGTFTGYGWDFTNETANGTEDIWQMCGDGVDYPKLAWQFTEGGFVCPASGYGPADLAVIINCWLSVIQATADINKDHTVNLADFLTLAQYWQQFDCGVCGGADVTGDGNVDSADLMDIADQWLVTENADCQIADLSGDNEVDLEDAVILSRHWLEGDPGGGVE
jgi:hypothetical protein